MTVNANIKQMHSVIINITPDQAFRWLEGNVKNRPVNQAHVDRLVEDMKAGRWKLTHQGIAFDVNGTLQDGQHRLWAIVTSKCTVAMTVAFNVPVDAIEYVDCGKGRSVVDRITLSGRFGEEGVDRGQLATLRAMLGYFSNNASSRPISLEMDQLAQHKHAIDFAIDHLWTTRVRGVGSAVTCAVVARAWYSIDLETLRRFCEVLCNGMARGDDEAVIILLRDYLNGQDRSRKSASMKDQYGKVERALHAYINGKSLTLLRPCQAELFPLPNEEAKVA